LHLSFASDPDYLKLIDLETVIPTSIDQRPVKMLSFTLGILLSHSRRLQTVANYL
jgi:hypothetical protein